MLEATSAGCHAFHRRWIVVDARAESIQSIRATHIAMPRVLGGSGRVAMWSSLEMGNTGCYRRWI